MCKMMEKLLFFGMVFFVHGISAKDVIYKLDDEDYYRIPLKNHLDRYEPCVGVKGGVYCTAEADLVSDQPNELLDMVNAYSAHGEKHFNYSNILRGLCMSKTCKQYYDGDTSEPALWKSAEACLNDSLTREHGLKARLFGLRCYHHGDSITPDTIDKVVTAVLLTILAFNVVGSLYDFLIRDQSKPGNRVLMSFALRANWRQFVAPPSEDPRQVQLRPINGIRVLTAFLVILGHVPVPSVIAVDNPTWFEWTYRTTLYHILYQGHLITLTFFLISGFLLTYNIEVQSEKRKLTWRILPKVIFIRWLRLTPVNLVILSITVSWLRFTKQGPFWWIAIGREWSDCRQYWLYNAFYINNLIDHSTCNMQTWSLASDMQLHVIGLAVVLLSPSVRARRAIMVALYVIGIAWPAYHIYTKDLDGSLLATPTTISTFFLTSDAFNYVYKRTYSNLPCFVMGMAFGYFFYSLQKRNRVTGDYSRYWPLYQMTVATMPATITVAYFLFFQDAPRASMLTRLLFAPLVKPLFGIILILTILGAIYKLDGLISSLLSWRGWTPLSRVSYCVYAVHVCLVRYLGGSKQTLSYFSFLHMLQEYTGTVALAVVFAMLLYLLVEAPFAQLVRVCIGPLTIKEPISTQANDVNGVTKVLAANGHAANGDAANGHAANGHATNVNGHVANRLKED